MDISQKNNYLPVLGIHVGIGFAVYLFEPLAKLYFFASLGFFLYLIFKSGNKNNEAIYAAAYMAGGEVFFRMTQAAPAYEAGKYSVIAFLFIGLVLSGTSRKSGVYWLYLFLLVPGILFSVINLNLGTDVKKAIFFNLSGPVCLGLSALYCVNRKVTIRQLDNLVKWLMLPLVAMAIFLTFDTPDLRASLRDTSANYAASGGFGPNQVSTALGLGVFLMLVQLITNSKHKMLKYIHLAGIGFFLYRAIVTFSRGGVITGLLISFAFLVVYFISVRKARQKVTGYLVLLGVIIVGAWAYSSFQTRGLIDKRYTNRDAAGRLKSDITTGRAELASAELSAFYENPLTGIGIGKIKEYREEKIGVSAASHNEVSRLLSEHGIFGLIILIILVIYPLVYRSTNRRNYLFYSALGFWFLTINHSSMRIAAPAFIYALALLNVVNEKKKTPIHRERLIPAR